MIVDVVTDPGHTVLGYQSRYSEYKSAIDKVHGEFVFGPSSFGGHADIKQGSLCNWCMPRMIPDAGSIEDSLLVSPSITDPIMPLRFDGLQTTDPFLCHYFFDCKMTRSMSVNSLPTF